MYNKALQEILRWTYYWAGYVGKQEANNIAVTNNNWWSSRLID